MQTAKEQTPSFGPFRSPAPLSRRRFGLLLAAAGALLAPVRSVTGALALNATAAAAATPLADLGYPELRLVATDAGPEAPRQIEAGRYLVVLENRGTPGGPAHVSDVNFIQLPPGASIDELNALLDDPAAPLPDWMGEIVSSGGFYVEAGQTGYAVLDLEPGDWYVGVGDANPFTPLTVTEHGAATPAPPGDPAADVTVGYREFALDLPDRIPAGRLIWHARNGGAQTHFLTFARTTGLLTVEQVQTLLTLPEGGTPPPGVPDMSTVEVLVTELKNLSPGRQIWVELDLAPGDYAAFCSLPDPESGMPHALLGEIAVFTVG
jgi:hypothetical protein